MCRPSNNHPLREPEHETGSGKGRRVGTFGCLNATHVWTRGGCAGLFRCGNRDSGDRAACGRSSQYPDGFMSCACDVPHPIMKHDWIQKCSSNTSTIGRLPLHQLRSVMRAVDALTCTTTLANGTVAPIETVHRSERGRYLGSFKWRELLPAVFEALDPAMVCGDVYQFGVFTGKSVKRLHAMSALKHSRVLGFDSFRGLPEEDTERSTHTTAFLKGMFSADPRTRLRHAVGQDSIEFIAGYYNESLVQPGLVSRVGMNPARYVDVDVDLYVSTRDLLHFLLTHNLLVPGTVIGYDDWWSHACAKNAGPHLSPLDQGEGLAHVEAAHAFKVTFACIAGGCRPAGRACGAFGVIFLVVSVGHRADHGFAMTREELVAWKHADESCNFVRTQTNDRIFGRRNA